MNKIFKYMSVLLLISGLLVCTYAKENGNGRLRKVEAEPSIYKFNVNNISTFIYADGRADVNGNNSGFEFPKGSNTFAFYESGFTWGGKINGGEVRFGGSCFQSGLVYGKVGQDPETSRMYRVRPDYMTGSMLSEMNDHEKGGDETAIRQQYRLDWDEWPAADGAPYFDADGDGIYKPDPDGNGQYDLGEDIPGVPGASQTIFFIANAADGDKSRQFYGSPPQEIEMHTTVWGYTSVGPLGNMIFKKYDLFNKGDADYTDFYVGVWADPDLGNAGDDFVGCDTLLSLGYVYNSSPTDSQYDDKPPASGHDFFQGPIVPSAGDTALVSGELIPDWKNLGMTAFYYFVNENGTPYSDPDLDDYQTGTLYFYMLMQGRIGATGDYFPIPDELGGGVTPYPLSGDPVEGTGYVDGIIKPTDDRRYGMSSGPFTLAAGDHQEIVIAQLVAQSVNNIESVRLIKIYDAFAQQAYDDNFVLPSAPTPPVLTYSVFDQEILLLWDSDPEIVAATESHDVKDYKFQGYNVYQLPSASSGIKDAMKIATFDIVDGIKTITDAAKDDVTQADIVKVVQTGNDTGIKRNFLVTKDYLNNSELFNGTKYYFAVTAYAYSPDEFAIPNTLENVPVALTIVPQSTAPGVRLGAENGSDVTIEHTSGNSDGVITATVVDANAVTGDNYSVTFGTDEDSNPIWRLTNTSTGSVLLDNQTNQSGDADYLVVDGLQVVVSGPDPGIIDWDYEGERWISGVDLGTPWLFGGLDNGFNFFGSTITDGLDFYDVTMNWAGVTDEADVADKSAENLAALSMAEYPDRWSKAAVYRRDMNYDYNGIGDIPFAAYDMESDPPRRLNICFVEDNGSTVANDLWDMGWDGTAFAEDGGREYIFIMNSDYNEAADYDNDAKWGPADDVLYAIWPQNRSRDYLLEPFELMIYAANVNSQFDEFTFTAPSVLYDNNMAKDDVAEEVNVFPNPYYGANPQELNKYQRFVTFSHLPQNTKIRIFNLAGQLVRTIDKTSTDQFQRWDLLNQQALPVASGIYIAYIDMPDIGTTKVLKLAIIQEQQILDRY